MNKNYLGKAALLAVGVLLCLLALSIIPEKYYDDLGLRPIDLLADIKEKHIIKPKQKNKNKPKVLPPYQYEIPCPNGLTCIENLSEDSLAKLQLAESIRKMRGKKKTFHIAFFGDSFVEGDMMTGDLRDTLQRVYGGAGVGYMPITSHVAGYRISITHTFSKDWLTESIVDQPKPKAKFGIGGYVFTPVEGSWVKYSAVKKARLNQYHRVRILYSGADGEKITLNNVQEIILEKGEGVKEKTIELDSAKSIHLQFAQNGKLKLYGVILEGANDGLLLDNYSMRGNSGIGQAEVSETIYKQTDAIIKYDMVVLQYGLNVANSKYTDYQWYKISMNKALAHVKKSFPNCPIMIVSVSDRGSKAGTMKGIAELLEVQEEFATKHHMLFYNLWKAMGGEGSMANFVDRKWANKDYTHLTFEGGKFVAGQFAKAIIHALKEIEKHNNPFQIYAKR